MERVVGSKVFILHLPLMSSDSTRRLQEDFCICWRFYFTEQSDLTWDHVNKEGGIISKEVVWLGYFGS